MNCCALSSLCECPIFRQCAALLPELLLAVVAVVALVLSLTPLRFKPASVYVVLWAQLAVLLYSFYFLLVNPSTWTGSIMGGMLHPNTGHDLARLALQVIALTIAWMAKRHAQIKSRLGLEYFGVIIAATIALMLAVQASHLLMLFVSLEAASLLVVLLMAMPRREGNLAGAIAYLLQAGLSAVLLLWGILFLYAQTGTMNYDALAMKLFGNTDLFSVMGVGLVLASLAFKLGLFPFNYWIPSVYRGLSLPALGYVATASKFAGIVVLLDLLMDPFAGLFSYTLPLLSAIVIVTLIWSALSALHQAEFRKLFALSGSVHSAFMVAGVIFGIIHLGALHAVFFYALAYMAAILLALYCLLELDTNELTFDTLKNSYARHPGFAMMLVLGLASMAGLPPLSGFIAKFLFLFNGIKLHEWGIVAAMIIASVVGLYYYLSAIFTVVGRTGELSHGMELPQLRKLPRSTRVITGFLVVIVLGLGLVQGSMSLLWK